MATIKLDGGAGFFNINDDVLPSSNYRPLFQGDNIGLRERGGVIVVNPAPFTDWRDSTDSVYANRAALITDLQSKIYA